VDRNSRFPAIDTSFCDPGHRTTVTIFGLAGLLMS
jgi:hypothetical protein